MKKLMILVAAVAMMGFSQVNAQIDFSGGLEVALPLGDFGDAYSLGYGVSLGGEYGINDNISADLQVGYIFLSVDDALSEFIASSAMIPAQVGVRYYLDEVGSGLYLKGMVGIHSVSIKTEDIDLGPLGTIEGETTSDSNLSFGVGAGFFVNENIDASARFNIITSSEDGVDASNYIGIRIAYNVPGN